MKRAYKQLRARSSVNVYEETKLCAGENTVGENEVEEKKVN